MAVMGCPLPEVAEALEPFIRPRNEITTIRQDLQTYLHNQLGNEDSPRLSAATASSQNPPETSNIPPALSGVRKAYWKALQAHTAAQAKYDALKADLQHLRSSRPGTHPANPFLSDSINESYIFLLRLRETQRKLHIIDEAFSDISSTGNASSSNSVEGVVRRRSGEPPLAPPTEAAPFRPGPDVDERILQLKKAVLSTKHRIDAYGAEEGKDDEGEQGGQTGGGEVAGLQNALNELTGWMETQLSLIGTAEANTAAPPDTPNGRVSPQDSTPASLEEIANLYDAYLNARENVINTVNNPTPLASTDSSSVFTPPSSSRNSTSSSKMKSPSETLLPFIPFLAASKSSEQTHLQASGYMRRQISAAEGETHRFLSRFADESHLVHPGVERGSDWADAAAAAGKETEGYVRQRLQMGEKATDEARRVLEAIKEVGC